MDGDADGNDDGCALGTPDGDADGCKLGISDGDKDGSVDCDADGNEDGCALGTPDGTKLGACDMDGTELGTGVLSKRCILLALVEFFLHACQM